MIQLMILAAGMGTRFGGPKQLEKVINDNRLMDYGIYDALQAGFDEIVLVVREAHKEIFEDLYPYSFIKIVTQDIIDGHSKPLGTAHAVYSALDVLDNQFAVINGDDFYGKDSYILAYQHLLNGESLGLIAFPAKKTLSDFGPVMRGKCTLIDDYLTDIEEKAYSRVEDNLVSMNFWCFQNIHSQLKAGFLALDLKNTTEWYLPEFVKSILGDTACKVYESPSEWCGMTYKEDLGNLVERLNKLTEMGLYEEDVLRKYRSGI